VMRFWKVLPLAAATIFLSACGQFFVKPTGGGGTNTGNYLYVGNSAVASIAGFSLGASGLAAVSGSPNTLSATPSAIATTPGGSFLYASSLAGAIYGYSIGSTGGLTLLNSGSPVVSQISPVAIKVDITGNWLIAVDLTPTAYLFSIDASTGLLTAEGNIPLDAGTPNRIVFTPNNSLVYVALGTGGVDILTFNSSTGSLSGPTGLLKPMQTVNADQGLAVDPGSKYLFVTETGLNGLRVLSIGTSGALTELSGSPYTTGLGPNGVLVDSTGSYVYVANRTDSTASGFLLSATGGLTAIAGSPFATGANPVDLVEDMSNTYVAIACSGGTPDLEVLTIGTTTPGALQTFAKATTGTDPTGAAAVAAAK
jgi:6-phosphogluconolactonase